MVPIWTREKAEDSECIPFVSNISFGSNSVESWIFMAKSRKQNNIPKCPANWSMGKNSFHIKKNNNNNDDNSASKSVENCQRIEWAKEPNQICKTEEVVREKIKKAFQSHTHKCEHKLRIEQGIKWKDNMSIAKQETERKRKKRRPNHLEHTTQRTYFQAIFPVRYSWTNQKNVLHFFLDFPFFLASLSFSLSLVWAVCSNRQTRLPKRMPM